MGKIQRRTELKNVKGITLSEYSDGFFFIHCTGGEHDFVAETEKKTEIVSILHQMFIDKDRNLTVEFKNK